jgi:malate dehydrogenase (oxaloacetate-decarboxylating)(NADP+)
MQFVVHTAQRRPPSRLVFADGEDDSVLRAVRAVMDRHIAHPILLGRRAVIEPRARELGLRLGDDDIVDMETSALTPRLADSLYELRHLHGMTAVAAATSILDPTNFGLMLVAESLADGFVGGRTRIYPDTIRPAIQLVGLREGVSRISAIQLLALKDRLVFCADTMVNIDPSAEELAEIAILAAEAARMFGVEPRVAMLSFSSFGSVRHPLAARVARAVQLVHEQRPELVLDGEMHVDPAVVEQIARENYPHSRIQGDANVFIFPNLAAGNIGYKLVQRLGGGEAIGPILLGIRRPVAVLQPGSTVSDIVNLAAITAVAANLQAGSGRPDRERALAAAGR